MALYWPVVMAGQLVQRMPTSPSARAAVSSMLGSVPGVVLPFVLAWKFSNGSLSDIYLYAFGFASFAYALAYIPLEANSLPAAHRARAEGRSAFDAFVRRGVLWAVGIGILGSISVILAATVFEPEDGALSGQRAEVGVLLLTVMSGYMVAGAVNGFLSACQYAFDRFTIPLLSISIRSIVPLIICAIVNDSIDSLVVVAAGLSVGELIRSGWIVLGLTQLRQKLPIARPESEVSSPMFATSESYMRLAGINVVASLISGAGPVVDKAFAARMPAGSVTIIDLSEKMLQIPLTILTSSVILVHGSRWASRGADRQSDIEQHKGSVIQSLRVILVATLGATLALAILTLSGGVYFSQAIGAADPGLLVLCGTALALSLPGAVLTNVGARYLTAARRTSRLLTYSIIGLIVNVVGNTLLSSCFGLLGIVLATVAARWFLGGINFLDVVRSEQVPRRFAAQRKVG